MRCSVLGCISKKSNGNGINFFRFPTKLQQREQWLNNLNILTTESQKNSFVCSKHFEQKYFKTNNGKQRLLPGAVPTKCFNSNYDKTTHKLVPIQPKPSPIYPANQNILIKPLPIVVLPLQNDNTNLINTNLNVNQNFGNFQTQLINLNNQVESDETIQISENIVEINNSEEENDDEDESVISINSDDETQNSSKLDESCYILVEVNDKKDGNLNSQDDANIVASGFNIKELIDDAKIAMKNKHEEDQITTKRKIKKWRPNHVGDCVFEDMEDPVIRKHHWTLALNEISKLRKKIKTLEQKNRRLVKRLSNANMTVSQLKQNIDVQNETDDSS